MKRLIWIGLLAAALAGCAVMMAHTGVDDNMVVWVKYTWRF